MRRRGFVLAGLAFALVAGQADACQPPPPPSDPFDEFRWVSETQVVAYWDRTTWLVGDAVTGRAEFVSSPPRATPLKVDWPIQSPDGTFTLDAARNRFLGCGMGNEVVRVHLVGPEVQRTWSATERGNTSTPSVGTGSPRSPEYERPWSGAVWNGTDAAYVWDHGTSTLFRIDWSTGEMTSRQHEAHGLPAPSDALQPLLLSGRRLVLSGFAGAVVIDPAGPSHWIGPPHPDMVLHDIKAETAMFRGVDGDSAVWTAVDLGTGFVQWEARIEDPVHAVAWTPRLLVAITGGEGQYSNQHGGSVVRFLDGAALSSIPLGDDDRTRLAASGERVALGMAGPKPRLIVFGTDGHAILEFPPPGPSPPPTRPVPLGSGLVVAAVVGALAVQRMARVRD